MAAASWFRYTYLAHASRPKSVRQLYRLVKQRRICRVVEIGVSDISRSQALIEVSQRFAGQQKVVYTGIDWFDARTESMDALSLKAAYRLLRTTGVSLRLAPGEPGRSLAAAANAHPNTDLILIAPFISDSELEQAWFYVPRMLHEQTILLREERDPQGQPAFKKLTHGQVSEWAGRDTRRRAA